MEATVKVIILRSILGVAVIALFLISAPSVHGAEKRPSRQSLKQSSRQRLPAQAKQLKKTKDAAPPVLDFEADVIEGQGKKPDVFLDFSSDTTTLDSIVYRRSDFNDYFLKMSKNRLRYQQSK